MRKNRQYILERTSQSSKFLMKNCLKGEIYYEFQNEQNKAYRKGDALGAFGDECIELCGVW